MSYADRVRDAADPKSAMLVIAEGLDAILSRPEPSDEWGQWGGGSTATADDTVPPPADFYAAKQAPVDQAQVARAMDKLMQVEQMYERSPTPQALSMLEQAQKAVELAMEPGEYLDHSGDIEGASDLIRVDESDDQIIVDLPPASEARKEARRALAEHIDLPGFFPPIMRSSDAAREEIMRSYELGGPLWLYANRVVGDHDIFEQFPANAKAAMISDVALDSTKEAWQFQRDIMKADDAEGETLGIAQDFQQSVSAGAQVALG